MTAKNMLEPVSEQNLPALIDRARSRLAEARTSAEVLEAKMAAELALHYARLTKAANETHADCLRMIVRAEMRMADEVDAAQERGEVMRKGEPQVNIHGVVRTSDYIPANLDDIGIDKRRLHEWRKVRDIGEERVEQVIAAALEEGRAPTKNDILSHAHNHRAQGTGENEWFTPPQYIAAARDVLGEIDLDPASHPVAQRTVRATKFFTKDNDGLRQEWHGRVWLNPPYAPPLIGQFVSKLIEEFSSGRVTSAVMLTHNYTDTAWFHSAEKIASRICFTRGRVKFLGIDGEECAPTQGQAFFYYGADIEKFSAIFAEFGFIR